MTGFLLPTAAIATVDEYFAAGGGSGLATALRLGPKGTIECVDRAGVRGRGGAGFPAARKWTSVAHGPPGERFVVVNAAEGEPATFKDRLLLRLDPYRVIEGAAIASVAVGAATIYVATKRQYADEVEAIRRAALELTGSGLLQELSIQIVEGPGDYLFGEEKALLEVIEGRDPLPRLLPPYELGLWATDAPVGWESGARAVKGAATANPTVVNNVETLATVAHVLAKGTDWFRTMGTEGSPGTLIASVVGDVTRPGAHEVEMGTPFSELLDKCGGARPGRTLRAALSGVSNAVLTANSFDTPLTYEDFKAAGSGLGAAGFVVYDDSVNMIAVARAMSRFLARESCGQCPPCKLGSTAITEHLDAICAGSADPSVVDEIAAVLRQVTDANRCFLGSEEQIVVSSILQAFPDDLAGLLAGEPLGRDVTVPIIDRIDGNGTPIISTARW